MRLASGSPAVLYTQPPRPPQLNLLNLLNLFDPIRFRSLDLFDRLLLLHRLFSLCASLDRRSLARVPPGNRSEPIFLSRLARGCVFLPLFRAQPG
jgi:hypothetical protein